MVQSISTDSLPLIEAKSLEEWLGLIATPPQGRSFEVIERWFPTDEIRDDYLRRVSKFSERQVKDVLRKFLANTGWSSLDLVTLQFWVSAGMLNAVVERSEFAKRLVDKNRPNWEGLSWVLDLLPDSPRLAIGAIDGYLQAHVDVMGDGRMQGLSDAIAIIRARYFEWRNSRDLLLGLDPWDFEYLVAALYGEMGYTVKVTSRRRDGGLDIRISKGESGTREDSLVECKRYKGKVTVEQVRALYGVVDEQRAMKGILVTTGGFTKPAEAFARSTNRMDLVGFAELNRLLNEEFGPEWPRRMDTHISWAKREHDPRSPQMPKEISQMRPTL